MYCMFAFLADSKKSSCSGRSGEDIATNAVESCDNRESELEIKGLRAKILVLEQTLQDTNSGVEHAANVLRMQCTAHIQKSASLHAALARSAAENYHEMEKTISDLRIRESELIEQRDRQREEIEKLRAERSEQAQQITKRIMCNAATDPISPNVLGESAAELAAACSGRLRDAWTQNEKLMEALEAEKRRSLMLELELQQLASNAPSTWL
jgi:DNA repair exonuclease SbcCD ATPase subunit